MLKKSMFISLALYFFILISAYFLYHNLSPYLLLDHFSYQQKKSFEIVLLLFFSAVFWLYRLYQLAIHFMSEMEKKSDHVNVSQSLIEHESNLLFCINNRGNITFISPVCLTLLGYRQDELMSRPLSSIFLKEQDYQVLNEQILSMSINAQCLQLIVVCKDGAQIWAEIRSVVCQTEQGTELKGNLKDINAQRLMSLALDNKENTLRSVIDNIPYLVFIKDENNKTMLANQSAADFLGESLENLVNSNDLSLHSDPFEAMLPSRFVKHHMNTPSYKKELIDKNGVLHEASFAQYKIKQDNDLHLTLTIGKLLSISERRTESIEHFLRYDLLTGLLNRNVFINQLENYISNLASPNLTAICVVDLSNFKRINDTLGHDIGDQALTFSAQKIALLGESLSMLCRYNGDEFAFVLKGIVSLEHLHSQLEKLHNLFESPLNLQGVDVKLSLNIGAVISPQDGTSAEVLLKKLDIALHVAKSSDALRTQFYTGVLEETLQANMLIEKHLAYALEKGEFRLVFQPFVSSKYDSLLGAEVLLRWHSEVLGEVYPDQFIPIAEQTGDIVAIGSWVIEQACLQVKTWRKLFGEDFYLAVNVSPRQFLYGDLVNVVDRAQQENDLSAQSIEIEITEGLLIRDQALVLKTMQSLNSRGVRLSLDDFGTGYSSLNYLKNFPFDCLKIDRAFITDINTDKQNDALVVAITEMAHALNLSVVAEGVEDLSQLTRLRTLSVDIIQGYYFSKPLSYQDFEYWYKQSKDSHFLANIER